MSAETQIVVWVEEFLSALAHERAASPHTLRAYRRELHDFATYLVAKRGPDVWLERSNISRFGRI